MVRYYITMRHTEGDGTPSMVAKRDLQKRIRYWQSTLFGVGGKSRIIKQKVTWIDGVKKIEETDVTEAI